MYSEGIQVICDTNILLGLGSRALRKLSELKRVDLCTSFISIVELMSHIDQVGISEFARYRAALWKAATFCPTWLADPDTALRSYFNLNSRISPDTISRLKADVGITTSSAASQEVKSNGVKTEWYKRKREEIADIFLGGIDDFLAEVGSNKIINDLPYFTLAEFGQTIMERASKGEKGPLYTDPEKVGKDFRLYAIAFEKYLAEVSEKGKTWVDRHHDDNDCNDIHLFVYLVSPKCILLTQEIKWLELSETPEGKNRIMSPDQFQHLYPTIFIGSE